MLLSDLESTMRPSREPNSFSCPHYMWKKEGMLRFKDYTSDRNMLLSRVDYRNRRIAQAQRKFQILILNSRFW